MLTRVSTIMFNTYREAVRARILHGLFGLSLVTAAYAMVVGQYASRSAMRIVSDLGAASTSLYAILVAIVIGATSLYRELELKTIFPILAKPLGRGEYLVGKFLGAWLTLAVFSLANAAVVLLALAVMADRPWWQAVGVGVGSVAIFALLAWRSVIWRLQLPLVWALFLFASSYLLARPAGGDRQVVTLAVVLCLLEVGIVSAIATLFSAFSSPFLTALFTLGVFIVGRSADTLATLPSRVFGEGIQRMGAVLSHVVPNLVAYVPPRSLLLGEVTDTAPSTYLLTAGLQALGWCVGLLAAATFIFKRRDFI